LAQVEGKIATCSVDGSIKYWNLLDGAQSLKPTQDIFNEKKVVAPFRHQTSIMSVDISSNSNVIISSSRDNHVCVWRRNQSGVSDIELLYDFIPCEFTITSVRFIYQSSQGDYTFACASISSSIFIYTFNVNSPKKTGYITTFSFFFPFFF